MRDSTRQRLRRHRSVTAAVLAAATLAGCATAPTGDRSPAERSAEPRVPAVTTDWARAETVSVTLSDFHFTPERLVLRQGAPYRLHLANLSNTSHTFTSAPFFRAIAVRRGPASTEAPPLGTIALAPGEQKDLYFVAAKPGSYDFECSELLHSMLGMTGQIAILQSG